MNRLRLQLVVAAFVLLANTITLVQQKSSLAGGTGPTDLKATKAMDSDRSDEGVTGPYNVVKGWPKPMSSWPDHHGWTWGSTQGIFAQNPNRVFIVQRGELPELKRSSGVLPDQDIVEYNGGVNGPVHLSVPVALLPARNASVDRTASPGEPDVKFSSVEGKDYRWEHCLIVVDAQGNLVEAWTQWDKLFKRTHKVLISPYDPEKRVWVVDDGRNAIFIFSNDGKQLLQTIGTPNEKGDDDKHFWRQTDIAWLPDGTFFVSDGYQNTRVVKFDKNGKFLMAWGKKGINDDLLGASDKVETRPGYFNTVHGIAVDNQRRVYVSDRSNHRIQIFDENGHFLDLWNLGEYGIPYHLYMSADQHLWISDGHGTWKILKYALDGTLLYSWGTWGPLPGELWGVHQIHVDQEGNLYTAEVFNGRAQKWTPKKGADPAKVMGKPVYAAWQN